MKIMVCGPINGNETNMARIKQVYAFLKKQGFDTVDHVIDESMDYSHVGDFRYYKSLSDKITQKDIEFVKQASVIVVLADNPSYGTAIEQYVAKNMNKTVIVLSEHPVRSPWPISFADIVVTNYDELCKELTNL